MERNKRGMCVSQKKFEFRLGGGFKKDILRLFFQAHFSTDLFSSSGKTKRDLLDNGTWNWPKEHSK